MIDRAYVLGPMQVVASKFLMSMKEFPPSQAPGDWKSRRSKNEGQTDDHRRKMIAFRLMGVVGQRRRLFS